MRKNKRAQSGKRQAATGAVALLSSSGLRTAPWRHYYPGKVRSAELQTAGELAALRLTDRNRNEIEILK